MRGRGIGSYGLGDKYVSPDRRLAKMLMETNSRKGQPSNNWVESLGRIAQQLAGGYLVGRDRKNQDVANKAFTGVQPDSYTRQPTISEADARGSSQVGDILEQYNDQNLMEGPMVRYNVKKIGEQQDRITQAEKAINEANNPETPSYINDPADRARRIEFENQSIADANMDIDRFGDQFNAQMIGGRTNKDEYVNREVREQMEASEQDVLDKKMPQSEYSMQNLRGLTDNPYAQRLLQGLMMQSADRDYASGLAETKRGYDVTDATTVYDRQKELKQMPMSSKQFEQKQLLTKPPRQQFLTTAEGVFMVNPDGSKGLRVGSTPTLSGFPSQIGGANTPQGGLGQVGPATNQSGVPVHGEKPWERLPPRNQGPMQQEVHKTSRAMLEKNRQEIAKMQTMGESLQRFQYLNKKQDKEAESELFGTKTGSVIDRMTDMSLDPDKQEMVRIQNLLTPQMRQGMPGAASDRDVAMFRGATVGINVEREVNDNLVSGAMARLKNLKDRQSFMEEYFQKNQHLDGAETYWKEYLEANPIFDHSPELVGSYTLNKNRKSYGEFFDEKSAIRLVDPSRRSTDKKRSTDIPEGFTVSEWGRLSKQEQNEYIEAIE